MKRPGDFSVHWNFNAWTFSLFTSIRTTATAAGVKAVYLCWAAERLTHWAITAGTSHTFFNFKMLNNQWHMLSNRFYTFKWQAPQISNKGCLSFYYWQTSVVQLEPLGTSGILLLLRNQTLLLRTEIWKPSGFLELAESQLKPTNHFATNLQEGHQFRDRQKCARRAKCC